MSLASQIASLASRVATEFKTVRAELASGLSGKASTSHTHTKSQVTDFAHASTHASAGSDPITVAQSQVTGLSTSLAGKSDTTHTHALSGLSDTQVSTPSSGQALVYNGTKWANASVGGGVSDTAPSSPSAGQQWFNSATGQTFVYYDSFWIEQDTVGTTGPQGSSGVLSVSAPLTNTGTSTSAVLGIQSNPSFTGVGTFTDGIITTNASGDGQALRLKARSDGFNQIAWYNNTGSNFMGLWQVGADSAINLAQNTTYSGSTQNFQNRLSINPSGHVTLAAQPIFQCGPYISGTTGNAYLDLSNDIQVNVGFTLTNSTTLTVQTAGKYLVVARHLMSSSTSNYYHVQKNNVTIKHGWTNAIMIDYGVSAVLDCAANDTIRLYLQNAITQQWNGPHSSLLVVKVA
jgi:Phage tail repeat like